MIEVKENKDGSFDITWDENDPVESQLNSWNEHDFIDAIMSECNRTFEKELKKIATALGGTLSHYVCSNNNTEHKKYVIEYDSQRKG